MTRSLDVAARCTLRIVPTALRVLRRAVLLGGVLALAWGLSACGRVERVTQPDDGMVVTLAVEPTPAVVGDARLIVTLADRDGKPVEGARIEVEGNMNHAGMKPEFGRAEGGQGGRYVVPIRWTMSGAWYVDVKATLPDGRTINRRFPLNVR